MAKPRPDIEFSAAQLQWLREQFPHVVYSHTTSEAQMRWYFGQQSVLAVIQGRTRGTQNDSDLPTT